MAVRRWWRLWKRPGQRAEEKDIGTNPSGVKHRSSYIPVPFLLSLSLSLPPFPHATTDVFPSLRLFVCRFSILPAFTRMPSRFDVPLEKLTRALCLPHRHEGSFRVLFAPVESHGNSFSHFLPAYLSIYSHFLLYSSFSILPIRLPIYP